MSKSSQKYHTSKRRSQPVLTKRTPRNKHKHDIQVGHAERLKFRQLYFKLKNIEKNYVTGRAA